VGHDGKNENNFSNVPVEVFSVGGRFPYFCRANGVCVLQRTSAVPRGEKVNYTCTFATGLPCTPALPIFFFAVAVLFFWFQLSLQSK